MIKNMGIVSLLLTSSLCAQSVTLNEAIAIALQNNKQLKISSRSLAIADTLYNQAMSANYPTLDVSVNAVRLDQAPTFDMRGTAIIDNQAQLLGTAKTLDGLDNTKTYMTTGTPGNSSTNTQAAQAMIASGQVPAQSNLPISMTVPMMGRDTVTSQARVMLPLYTGGKISALTQQAELGKQIAVQGIARSRAEVIYDVKKYYYGAVLAKKIKQLTSDTLERMEFIRDLTSSMYKGGSMSVKKTDYLRSVMSVNMIKVFYEDISSKELMARSALANAMGYEWNQEVDVADTQMPVPTMDKPLEQMVKKAYDFNPDFNTLRLALKVKDAQIDEAKSDYLPHAAVMASAQNMYNDYQYGVINDTNKNSGAIGIGLEWSLFDGMRTSNKVEQSRLEKLQLEDQQILLKDGLALQVKDAYMQMDSSYKKYQALVDSVKIASENRELNTKAYQEDMVPTKDVIEAQLFEALTQADFYRAENDFALGHAKADEIVGEVIESKLVK